MHVETLQWPVLLASFASIASPWYFRKHLIGPPWMRAWVSASLVSLATGSSAHERIFVGLLLPLFLFGVYLQFFRGDISSVLGDMSSVIVMTIIPIALVILLAAILPTKFVIASLPVVVPATMVYFILVGIAIVVSNCLALWHAFYQGEIRYIYLVSESRVNVSVDPLFFWLVVIGGASTVAIVLALFSIGYNEYRTPNKELDKTRADIARASQRER